MTAWVCRIREIARMSSIKGLPTRGSDITILIKKVHLHPLCVLVEFWGNFWENRTSDYECLAKEIQCPGNTSEEIEGNPGDQCLVQIDGTWYRSRIVSRNGSKYTVFLIDKGTSYRTTASNLAWGKKKHFSLPPEVEHCVLANVLPVSPENRWSQLALEFLKSLSGKSVKAYVQDVLIQRRTFLLHINCISKQMHEMGMAKQYSPEKFQDFVHMSLQSNSGAEVSPETKQISTGQGERLHKEVHFMYPELPEGTFETVVVTEVTSPQQIFCQLKVFSKELKKLSEQITKSYEGRMTNCIISPEMIGFPCAARGSDGRWYRSVLQQVFQTCNVVEVLNVDYGTKPFVHVENVKPLAAEFFRMPVVTYTCSLYGSFEKRVGWTNSQVDYLRTLLLHKTVIAKFEYQSISEGVQYVTLYGDEDTNINDLFESKERGSLDCEKALDDYAIQSSSYGQHPALPERSPVRVVEEKEEKGRVEKLPVEEISLSSSHVAFVQHVTDPSEFWIQTQNYADEFDELMDSIYHLYKDSLNKDVVSNPTVGLYCTAMAEDGTFYRATVAEVGETQIKVFFVDYGNTEVVERRDIRTLPDKFKKLPCLALKCTLAGVKPKEMERWSQSACEFFSKAVTDKTLNVHVMAKYDESYAVQLSYPKAEGGEDLATQMCSSGLAERAEIQRQPKAQMTKQPAPLAPTQLLDARISGVFRNSEMYVKPPNTCGPSNEDRRIPSFKEHMFSIGSVLDVTVSYIESPNDFWCQLVQNAEHLKLLMHSLQTFYASSEVQPPVETACVARHPHNGMWYRALVIHKHDTHHVDVLFVDYGQRETVSSNDLRRICPQFLNLHGQAFRCSLLNPVDPTSATNEWNEEAIAKFHSFVDNATSKFVILKCTVYAIMCSEQKIVFNIVNLETPFESVSTSMMNLVKSSSPRTVTGPSFRLDTYYYSTHNVKVGTEEEVTVTYVNSVNQFYCQLQRNSEVIEDLKVQVNSLCHQLMNAKLPTVCGTLCFARFTDGQWYRGQIKATRPVILVHFVDYGDTVEVERSNLLPVPKEANGIMSVPVQAVVCSLSDVPVDVPSDVNSWFDTNTTGSKVRALIVAREPDGKLLVELYHGTFQINSKLKKMFRVEVQTEEQILHWSHRDLASVNPAQKAPKAVPKQAEDMKDHAQTIKKNGTAPKPTCQTRDADMSMINATKPLLSENGDKVKAARLQLYKPPHQRQSCERSRDKTGNDSEVAGANFKPRKESLPTETKKLVQTNSPGTESQKQFHAENLPKLADLPSTCITSGMEADVYVSHCNSPLSFYVQLVREEDELFSLVEKLNDPQSVPQTDNITDVHPGDLVQAEFPDDSSWYRALVKESHSNMMALVEFVDFGNAAMLPISKIARISKDFLKVPMYSTHCTLSDAAALGKEEVLDPKVASAFKEDVCGNGEKVLKCHFIRPSGSMWEVSLEDGGRNVMCKVSTSCTTDDIAVISQTIEQDKEKPAQNSDIRQLPEKSQKSPPNTFSLCYHQQELLEGQRLDVYITTLNDTLTFWCQPTDSEEFVKLSEVGDADHNHVDLNSLSPGSPCIALFSDDHSWYRAEVIHKDEDKLSVLFVDYGNISQVSVTDVRELPTDLIETPPQAFMCELEGFDSSSGSWDSGAVDELSALTTDKDVQLTVTRVTREEGKLKCFVRMECQGQVINEAMKTRWKTIVTEDIAIAVGPTTSYEATLQCDSTMKETAPPEDQLECAESQSDATVACIMPQRDHSDEQGDSELVDLAELPELASSKSSSEHYLYSEAILEFQEEERDPVFSEGNVITETQKLRMTAIPTKTDSNEVIIVPTMVDSGDGGIEASMFLPLDNKRDQDFLTLSCDTTGVETDGGTVEEGDSAIDAVGLDALNTPLDRSPVETMDECLPGEANTFSVESSFDITHISDPNQQRDEASEVPIPEDNHRSSTTTVKMVPCKEEFPTFDPSKDLKQIQTELVLSSCLPPAFDAPSEQDIEAGDGVPKEDVPYLATHVEHDLMAEETSDYYQDTLSALLADPDTAAGDLHTSTEASQDSGDGVEELTCVVQEACLTDLVTDPNQERDEASEVNIPEDNHRSSTTTVKMVPCKEEFPTFDPSKDLKQIQTELVLSSCLPPTFDAPSEQDIEAGDDVPKEDVPYLATHVEHDLMAEETSDYYQDTLSAALLADLDTAAGDLHTSTEASQDSGDGVEELTCVVQEACLTDLVTGLNNDRRNPDWTFTRVTAVSKATHWSDPNQERDEASEVTIPEDNHRSSTTTVKMVPCEEAFPTFDPSKDLKQIQTELVLSSCLPPAFDAPSEQDIEAGDGVPKEDVPYLATHVEHDLMAEETLDYYQDTLSALLADPDTAAGDLHTSTEASQDSGDGVEELTCVVQEASLTDLGTDPNQQRDEASEVNIPEDNHRSSTTTVKMVPCEEEFPTFDPSKDLKQIQTELVLSSCLPPAFDAPSEQDIEAGDDVPKEVVPYLATHVEHDLMAEETSDYHQDTLSALLADPDTAAGDLHTSTEASQDSGDGVEELTCVVQEACLTDLGTDPNQERDEASEVNIPEDNHRSSTATVKMVPCEEEFPTFDPSKDLKQIQTELVLSSCLPPAFDAPSEQDIEAGDDVPKEDVPYLATHVEHDLMAEETSDYYQDTLSALLADPDTAAGDLHTSTEASQDSGDGVEELTCVVQEACLTDLGTDAPSEQDIEAGDGVPKEDVPYLATHVEHDLMAEETSDYYQDTLSALLADPDTAAGDLHTSTEASQDSGDGVEELTCVVQEACLTDLGTDPNQERDEASEVTIPEDNHRSSTTTVKMVPCKEEFPTFDPSKDLKQIQTELVLSSCLPPAFDAPSEQDIEAGDGVPKEDVPYLATHVEHDLMAEETSDYYQDTLSALLADPDTAAGDLHTSTEASQDSGDGVEELTCVVQEACLTDLGTDQPCDTEPQAHTDPYPDLSNLVEEVTALVQQICLADVCGDPQQPNLEDNDNQTQDSSDDVPEDETFSSAEDSFEAQLANITHLYLKISDSTANVLPPEQQQQQQREE